MWTSSQVARSDVVLAPAGVWVGTALVGLVLSLPVWPSGLVRLALVAVATAVVMLGWPLWLARQRDESAIAGPFVAADLTAGIVASLPLLATGIAIAWLQDRSWPQVLAGIGTRVATGSPPVVALTLTITVITAAGAWLVITLVARRAPDGYGGPAIPATGVLRTHGLGLAAITTMLLLLLTVATGITWWAALLMGMALALTVLLVDRTLTSATVNRTAALAPAIVAMVLWIFRGGLLFGGNLLGDLTNAALAGTIALCMGLLAQQDRPWAAAPLSVVLAVWMGASILPVLG